MERLFPLRFQHVFFFIVVLGVISASSFISLSRQAVEQVQFDP